MNTIEKFLNTFPSKGTRKAYRSYLKRFFNTIDANPETYIEEDRDYEEDVLKFWKQMHEENAAPKTIKTAKAAVKSYLMEYDVEPREKFWRKLNRRSQGSGAVTEDEVPTNTQLKEILEHGKLKDRAFFLVMSSSGMRISEVIGLKLDDIDMKSTPTKVRVRANTAKGTKQRITFISEEATDIVKLWLKDRDRYLRQAIKKTNFGIKKSMDDPRLFPFSASTARNAWNRLLKKAEYNDRDSRTNWHKMRPHNLRKFFTTRMSLKMPDTVVEVLNGRVTGNKQVYYKYPPERLAEYYRKGEEELVVFEKPLGTEALEKLDKRVRDLEQEKMQLRKHIELITDRLERQLEPEDGIPPYFKMPDGTYERATFNRKLGGLQLTGEKITEEEYIELAEDWGHKQTEEYWEKMERK
jgi:integrase